MTSGQMGIAPNLVIAATLVPAKVTGRRITAMADRGSLAGEASELDLLSEASAGPACANVS